MSHVKFSAIQISTPDGQHGSRVASRTTGGPAAPAFAVPLEGRVVAALAYVWFTR